MDDAFADLLLVDPEDEQPQITSREARIARAFDQSKASYPSEVVITPPGWFQTHHIQANDTTKLDARNVEWSVQRLYLQQSYEEALRLAIEVLHAGGVRLDLTKDTGSASLHYVGNLTFGILPKNDARDREMLDAAIRSAMKLGDQNAAKDLAEATRSRWSNSPGLGYTAGEAFVFVNRPFDAISALLHAVRARTPSYPVLALLTEALNAAAETSTPHTTPLKELSGIIGQYAERIKPAFDKGLFPKATSMPDVKPPPKTKSATVTESTIRTMGEDSGLNEVDVGLLVSLCCASDAEEGVGSGERSVRSL